MYSLMCMEHEKTKMAGKYLAFIIVSVGTHARAHTRTQTDAPIHASDPWIRLLFLWRIYLAHFQVELIRGIAIQLFCWVDTEHWTSIGWLNSWWGEMSQWGNLILMGSGSTTADLIPQLSFSVRLFSAVVVEWSQSNQTVFIMWVFGCCLSHMEVTSGRPAYDPGYSKSRKQ